MTIPKSWQPGDPITAAQLNTGNVEASRPRRAITLGSGSSLVNETLGNQSASAKAPLIRLVVAIEDFAVQEEPTDLNGVIDDVSSGLVREVRLNRTSGQYTRDNASKSFRAYDTVSGVSGNVCESGSNSNSESASASASGSESGPVLSGKSDCDVFYVIFNQDSKRWEILEVGISSKVTTIRFRIVGSDSASFNVLGFVLAWDGDYGFDQLDIQDDVNGPGQIPLGVVEVCDPTGCFFDEPPDELFNRVGWARRMYSGTPDNCRSVYPPYPTLWEVFSLCCKRKACRFS
jgi:hypothetical protein